MAQGTPRKRVELGDVLKILAQICCGLDAVHHARIVHRDLKLADLFISPTLTNPLHLKILDLWLSSPTRRSRAGPIRSSMHRSWVPSTTRRPNRPGRWRTSMPALTSTRLASFRTVPTRSRSLILVLTRPTFRRRGGDLIMEMLAHDPGQRPMSALAIAHRFASTLPAENGDGHAILEKVSPLLKTPSWIQRSRRMQMPANPLEAFSTAGPERLPPRKTVTYSADDALAETETPLCWRRRYASPETRSAKSRHAEQRRGGGNLPPRILRSATRAASRFGSTRAI